MLAVCWPWSFGSSQDFAGLAQRLANSLCSGIGGKAFASEIDGVHFAYRPLGANGRAVAPWRPSTLPSGKTIAFHGYFDNRREIAAELSLQGADVARLYGAAVERWGADADNRVIGDYCAVITDPAGQTIRLSRSPLRAPPLHYWHDAQITVAASVPRAIFAAGVGQTLNRDRLADSALMNFTDDEATWSEGILRVPLGAIVELRPGAPRQLRRYYDLQARPDVRLPSDADYIARAGELMDEGVRAVLDGFRTPGATLSSGLDSPQVAVRTLAALPAGQRLPTFTFHPEAEWDGGCEHTMLGNERPFVEAFAAMHPGLEPHFTANEGYEHDYRWNDMFHVMGGAPSTLCNMYVFHGLFTAARARGCDLLVLSEWGNYTFSDQGEWAFVEYFLKGRWGQLWRALRDDPLDRRTVFRRFVAKSLVPLLPDPLWKALMAVWHRGEKSRLNLFTPLRDDFRIASGAQARLDATGRVLDRYQPWSRRHAQRILFENAEGEGAEVFQGFEQLYGIAMRDPLAYRPFVEFCFGLPTHLFCRDGVPRWLAKEMARGIMPEEQRRNLLNGRWDADWHLRIKRRRDDFLAELDRMEGDPEMAAMLDIAALRTALQTMPETTTTDIQALAPLEFALPRALLTARYVNYVSGRNG